MSDQIMHQFKGTPARHLETVDYKHERMLLCQCLKHRRHRIGHTILLVCHFVEQNILIPLTDSALIIAAQNLFMQFIHTASIQKCIKISGSVRTEHITDGV